MRRHYPERLVPSNLSICCEYMERESQSWERNVKEWTLDYLKRNGIPFREKKVGEEILLVIDFPSRWRQKFFILRANSEFPYFEFI